MDKIIFKIYRPDKKEIIYKLKVGSSVTAFLNYHPNDLWDYRGKSISIKTQNEILDVADEYYRLKYNIVNEILESDLEIYPQDVIDLEILGAVEDNNTEIRIYLKK